MENSTYPYHVANTLYRRLIFPAVKCTGSEEPEITFEINEIVSIAQKTMEELENEPVNCCAIEKPCYENYENYLGEQLQKLLNSWFEAADTLRFRRPNETSLKEYLEMFKSDPLKFLLMIPRPNINSNNLKAQAFINFDACDIILPALISPILTPLGWLSFARYIALFDGEPIIGWWLQVGGRLVRIKNCKEDRKHLYVSDHGLKYDIVSGMKQSLELLNPDSNVDLSSFLFWIWYSNLNFEGKSLFKNKFFLLLYQQKREILHKNELLFYALSIPYFYRRLVDLSSDELIPIHKNLIGQAVDVATPLSNEEEEILTRILKSDWRNEYTSIFHYVYELIRIKAIWSEKFVMAALESSSHSKVGLSSFFTQIDEIFHKDDATKIKNVFVLKELNKSSSMGEYEFLFRPVYSFGESEQGPSYNDFAKALQNHCKNNAATPLADIDSDIASKMRQIWSGESFEDNDLYFLPALCAAWNIEIARNSTTLLTNLILLDFLESKVVHEDSERNNLYSLIHMLIHPKKPINSRDAFPILDMYEDNKDLANWDGMHPMAHSGSVPGSKVLLGRKQKLQTVRQKEGHLLIHWLSMVLKKDGIDVRADKGQVLLSKDHTYDSVECLFKTMPSKKILKDRLKYRKHALLQKIKEKLKQRAATFTNFLDMPMSSETILEGSTGEANYTEGDIHSAVASSDSESNGKKLSD